MDINKLILRIIYFCIPILFLLFAYVILDPFRVIYSYNDYSKDMSVILNRDYVSTQVFENNYSKYNYDSFIFGSSRTLGFKTKDWKRYLNNDSSPYVFDSTGENLNGIYLKIKYLDNKGASLNNVVLVFDTDGTFVDKERNGHLLISDYRLNESSFFYFQMEFIKAYFNPGFLCRYYVYLLTDKFMPFMNGYIENRKIKFDTIRNDITLTSSDKELIINKELFYHKLINVFYKRTKNIELPEKITSNMREMMKSINQIFVKHNTNYRVIISPLYDQKVLNNKDMKVIHSIFGAENVFDFSGENSLTESKYNYYESSHFIPEVGNSIFRIIYEVKH